MRYYSTQRPLSPGSYPKFTQPGFENNVLGIQNFDEKTYCPEIDRDAWGYIEYEKPISPWGLVAWELTPAPKQRQMRVPTPAGDIVVRTANDPEHPGVWVDLQKNGAGPQLGLALIEFSADESDLPDTQPNIITRVWEDGLSDEYTHRIVHQRIDEFFRPEEGGTV